MIDCMTTVVLAGTSRGLLLTSRLRHSHPVIIMYGSRSTLLTEDDAAIFLCVHISALHIIAQTAPSFASSSSLASSPAPRASFAPFRSSWLSLPFSLLSASPRLYPRVGHLQLVPWRMRQRDRCLLDYGSLRVYEIPKGFSRDRPLYSPRV